MRSFKNYLEAHRMNELWGIEKWFGGKKQAPPAEDPDRTRAGGWGAAAKAPGHPSTAPERPPTAATIPPAAEPTAASPALQQIMREPISKKIYTLLHDLDGELVMPGEKVGTTQGQGDEMLGTQGGAHVSIFINETKRVFQDYQQISQQLNDLGQVWKNFRLSYLRIFFPGKVLESVEEVGIPEMPQGQPIYWKAAYMTLVKLDEKIEAIGKLLGSLISPPLSTLKEPFQKFHEQWKQVMGERSDIRQIYASWSEQGEEKSKQRILNDPNAKQDYDERHAQQAKIQQNKETRARIDARRGGMIRRWPGMGERDE
jgi:hypothetical protein